MELSFVAAALRRRWWIVANFAVLGLLPLLLLGDPTATTFESVAKIEVIPPDDARFNNPDRYVLNQVQILESRSIFEEVAAELNNTDRVGEVATQVEQATEIEQAAETDSVSIIVRQDDPARAQQVAQTIADTYINRLEQDERDLREPEIEQIDEELAELEVLLRAANDEIAEVYSPYLERIGEANFSVPPVSAVAPQAASDQARFTSEIDRLTIRKAALENEESRINTSISQPATLPVNAITESNGLIQMAFFIAMTLLGLTTALLWARFSSKVLDEVAVEEIVDVPVVASVRRSSTLRQEPLVALTRLPQELIATVDQISVQAEAMATINKTLRIAVVGSQRGAGVTTLSLAMAARFAAAEYSVVVVDADRRDPWLTDVFGAERHGGIPSLLGSNEDADRIYTRTSEPDVRLLGLGQKGTALRRELMPELVTRASGAAEVVIFDGGPLMDAASTVELCNVVDVVVLAIPLDDQRADDLAAVARQLGDVRDRVLPVITEPSRRIASRAPQTIDPYSTPIEDSSSATVPSSPPRRPAPMDQAPPSRSSSSARSRAAEAASADSRSNKQGAVAVDESAPANNRSSGQSSSSQKRTKNEQRRGNAGGSTAGSKKEK